MSSSIRPDEFSSYPLRLEQEETISPRNSMRLPPAAQLATVQFAASRGTSLFEDDIGQSQPYAVPQIAEDTALHLSRGTRTSFIAQVLKTTAVGSFAVIAIWGLGLMLFPNEQREETLSRDTTVAAETPPQRATVLQRQNDPSDNSQTAHNNAPAPQLENATYAVASVNPAGQSQPQQQLNQQMLQQPQVRARDVSLEEIDRLISWGKKFLAQGDLVTARIFLGRAAQARDPRAALMLGATYDPEGLRMLGVVGMPPDLKQAHAWYTQAAEFGSHEAKQRLIALAQLAR